MPSKAETPLASVCLLTYNHAPFIKQGLESVLAQNATFPWELVIADDCSTDGTRDVLKEYRDRYPDRIRLILQDRNVGPAANWIDLMNALVGKYASYLEGDDYWTDSSKLQKQVSFLEAHPDYVLCFTRGELRDMFTGTSTVRPPATENTDVTLADFIHANSQLTATCVYRRLPSVAKLPDYTDQFPFGDLFLYIWLLHTTGLKARVLSDVTAVYRLHAGGIYGSMRQSTKSGIRAYNQHLEFYAQLRRHVLGPDYDRAVTAATAQHYRGLSSLYVDDHDYRRAVVSLVKLSRASSLRIAGSVALDLGRQVASQVRRTLSRRLGLAP
jgi:glycosyltransferase involved in cell wall biosynthesis